MAERTPVITPCDRLYTQTGSNAEELDVDCWLVDRQSEQRLSIPHSSLILTAPSFVGKTEEKPRVPALQQPHFDFFHSDIAEGKKQEDALSLRATNSTSPKSGESLSSEIWQKTEGRYRETAPLTFWRSAADVGEKSTQENDFERIREEADMSAHWDCGLRIDSESSIEEFCLTPLSAKSHKSAARQKSHIQIHPLISPKSCRSPRNPLSPVGASVDFQRKALMALSRKRQKTGRKPSSHACVMCSASLPYKKELIQHLREAHGIARSKSLMYKRLQQGKEELQRLYGQG